MELAVEVLFWPVVACLVLTGIHSYLGLHVVLRGVIFVDLALAQIAAMGATFAFLLGYPEGGNQAYFYSLLFAVIGAAIFSILRLREQRIPQEAIIGITFVVASATAILIADRAPQGAELVEAMLTGQLLWVRPDKILQTALVYAAIGLFHWGFRDRFLTLTLEPDRAETEGWNVRWWDFLFYTSFALVITLSVSIAGVLLVFSFLVIPAVIAMMFSRSIGGQLVIGWATGTLVSMAGLTLSYQYDFPSGPAVVCTFGLALTLAGAVHYLARSEQFQWAVTKVSIGVLAIAGGLWLAFFSAERHMDEGLVEAVAETSGPALPTELREVAREALMQLAGSPENPPRDAVERLLAAGESVHLMMSTGEVKVSEAAVRALTNIPDDERVTELLDEIAFHAPDPWVRMRASQGLLIRREALGIEAMLELLETSQPILLRLEGIVALREATGQEFDYDPEGNLGLREEALARWRAWWTANAGQPFVAANPVSRR